MSCKSKVFCYLLLPGGGAVVAFNVVPDGLQLLFLRGQFCAPVDPLGESRPAPMALLRESLRRTPMAPLCKGGRVKNQGFFARGIAWGPPFRCQSLRLPFGQPPPFALGRRWPGAALCIPGISVGCSRSGGSSVCFPGDPCPGENAEQIHAPQSQHPNDVHMFPPV